MGRRVRRFVQIDEARPGREPQGLLTIIYIGVDSACSSKNKPELGPKSTLKQDRFALPATRDFKQDTVSMAILNCGANLCLIFMPHFFGIRL